MAARLEWAGAVPHPLRPGGQRLPKGKIGGATPLLMCMLKLSCAAEAAAQGVHACEFYEQQPEGRLDHERHTFFP